MKIYRFLLFFFIGLISCENNLDKNSTSNSQELVIKSVEVLKDSLILNGNLGTWNYNNQPYSGYAVGYHTNDRLKEKVGFYNGKKVGVSKLWYNNGALKMESYYNQNVLVNSYKSWWRNGVLSSESNYENGKLNGIERKWYNTGVLAKQRNLVDGQEHGIQKAWLKNGTLYVNYEAKNGRIFGMRRANSCYKLEDEIVIRKK
ncbi:MAG: antitoxin component YwqK of YwqJK toxin-antitoxin module [Porticoccaceae bacterium]|jgi:antitoxin component YwqK of YwqJK toxin-antitoxin module